jgi:hypothetical protein
MALTPEQRSIRASIAAHSRWSGEDPKVAMKKPRAGFEARFERQVDPDRLLSAAERKRRAKAAMRAHMARLALASSRARSKAKAS